jgi:hypothetical protein
MVVLLSTVISCSQAFAIINKIHRVIGLTEVQKTEIVQEIRNVIPRCPVTIVQEKKK